MWMLLSRGHRTSGLDLTICFGVFRMAKDAIDDKATAAKKELLLA